eukprot:3693607-Amphidinium_carterae.1
MACPRRFRFCAHDSAHENKHARHHCPWIPSEVFPEVLFEQLHHLCRDVTSTLGASVEATIHTRSASPLQDRGDVNQPDRDAFCKQGLQTRPPTIPLLHSRRRQKPTAKDESC